MSLVFEKDPQFDFELLRTMGQTAYGGAELGECLATARRVVEGDYDSWYREWSDTAEWVHATGEAALARGHRVSARDAFLRSANYFRTAEFFLHGDPADPRIRTASRRGVEAFRRAAALCEPAIEVLEIPYEGTTLPAYLYRSGAPGPRPTLLLHNGFDGTAEELWSMLGRPGQERGWNVLAFEGPGQGQVIREQGLPFRPDWENVVGPVLDVALSRSDIDGDRIALAGISMGGVLAPRAAAFDDRVAALVAFDGVYDMSTVPLDYVFSVAPDRREELLERLRAPEDPELDAAIERRIAEDGTTRWFSGHGRWVMGVPTTRALFARWADFTVAGGVAERITCPTLVMSGTRDATLGGQPEQLLAHLRAPATFVEFGPRYGGDLHNQVDVMRRAAATIYDWLDETLAR
ncbi:alpha/beta hydrolase family protein [Geodermatophilus sp. SYSU D01119]